MNNSIVANGEYIHSCVHLEDAELNYWDGFLSPENANTHFLTLKNEICWQSPKILMFGKWVQQPRLIAWQAEESYPYKYSGQTLIAEPFHPLVKDLCNRLNKTLNVNFNSVLINFYRNGSDSMGWHADNEPELGPNPRIASISLGGSRDFKLKQNNSPHKTFTFSLQHGSLLVMGDGVQSNYKHSIPKRVNAEPRINLTFRRIFLEN
jgi:alkylated DNA repair dioxygenase AlkB